MDTQPTPNTGLNDFGRDHAIPHISSLPNEILAIIYSLVCATSPEQCLERTISRVDTNWRLLAINTPELWTHICVIQKDQARDSLALAYAYAERSGTLPLRLEIRIMTAGIGSGPNIDSICQMMESHAGRWCSIYFETFVSQTLEPFLKATARPTFASLVSADFLIRDHAAVETEAMFLTSNASTPPFLFGGLTSFFANLRFLSFGQQFLQTLPTSLTFLEIQNPDNVYKLDSSVFTAALNRLQALETIVLNGDFIFGRHHSTGHTSVIMMPSLRRFFLLTSRDTSQMPAILSILQAPLLQTLLLESMIGVEFASLWSALNPRPFRAVRHLVMVDRGTLGYDRWNHLFSAFDSPESLTLYYSPLGFEKMFIEAFCFPPSDEAIPWTELQTLTLTCDADSAYIDPDLLQMPLISRSAAGFPLRRIRVSFDPLASFQKSFEWAGLSMEIEGFSTISLRQNAQVIESCGAFAPCDEFSI